jgi:hypothetical protein
MMARLAVAGVAVLGLLASVLGVDCARGSTRRAGRS